MSQDHLQQQIAISTTSTSTSPYQQHQYQQQHSSENSNNNTYRPCSPDLSAYVLPHQQQQQLQSSLFYHTYQDTAANNYNHNNNNNNNNNNNHPGASSSWQHQFQQQGQGSNSGLTGLPTGSGAYPHATHRGSYDASPYFSPQGSLSINQGPGQNQGSYFIGGSDSVGVSGQQQGQGQLQRRQTFGYASVSADAGEYSRLTHSPTTVDSGDRFGAGIDSVSLQHQHQQGQQGQQPFAHTFTSVFGDTAHNQGLDQVPTTNPPVSSLLSQPQQEARHSMPPSRRKRGQTDENDNSGDVDYNPEASTMGGEGGGGGGEGGMKPSRRKRRSDRSQTWRAPGEVGPSMGIDIKTKFPVARIKRIMQADEDVGKVAQATPTAVSKALELFMITLVTKAAAEAKDRSSKRVTAAHLKQAVIKDETFDFLQEIIEKVPDPTEKKGGRATSEDVDDGAGGGAPPKRKRAPRGKKKTDDDEH